KYQVSSIFQKTIDGLIKEKRPYKGVLYLGGIVVKNKVYTIEFNARWGDPEAEVILPSIKDDFFDLANIVIAGKLNQTKIIVDKKVRVVVAAVAKGYPVDYSRIKGKKVLGIEEVIKSGIKVYGAGIKDVNENYVVNGGRVLYVVGEGRDVIEARNKAYRAMKLISIEGDNLHYRTDIGWRDLERMEK
ncbi:MAG: phosphoribosylglycinamide synthetase C domain-containing protein, partial [Candidatus Daviesbacteria bacterium]|nr:phosphoribosylglycinamide synthetase C domain-containing protein [Candidatus Daviesbacteria bacterium]